MNHGKKWEIIGKLMLCIDASSRQQLKTIKLDDAAIIPECKSEHFDESFERRVLC